MRKYLLLTLSLLLAVNAKAQEKLILLNEGMWQADNGRVTYFEDDHVVSNQWFRDKNGMKIGDTPNDIIQINDNLIAIAVNWSNIVQFIRPDGTAVAATEDIPNNRKLCSDGQYVYVTSPEGIALYKGRLFVANTGGYAAQEAHDYETTVSILNAQTMQVEKVIDTHVPNLYGKMSQCGRYLCINSPGDYYELPAAGLVFDCQKALDGDANCFVKFDAPVTYNCTTRDGKFWAVGSSFSYLTGGYESYFLTIDPATVMDTQGSSGISQSLPGTLLTDFQNMDQPYGIYVNPYTGYIYGTDASMFEDAGYLYQWSPEGQLLGKYKVYVNPGHFLALPPDGHFTGVERRRASHSVKEHTCYDLQGRHIEAPQRVGIYVNKGRKYVNR